MLLRLVLHDKQSQGKLAEGETDSQQLKVTYFLQTIKRRMQKELGIIIHRTTQQIVEYHPPAPPDDPPTTGPAYLKADSREAKLLQELLQVS